MSKIKKYVFQTIMVLVLVAGLWSCTNMDEHYENFIKDGEVSYTGKIDSLHIYGGKNRVNVKGLIISDPKVSEVRIFWNTGRDSVVVPITRTSGVNVVDVIIDGLVENVYNFEIRTYDKLGNKSIPVFKIGNTYGQRYEATLLADIINRNIATGIVNGTALNGTLESLNDYTKKSLYSVLTYTATDDTQKQLIVQSNQNAFTIADYKLGTYIKYKTAYQPEVGAIDTFFTPEKSFSTQVDVTGTYLVNANFETNPTGAALATMVYDVPGWTEVPVAGTTNDFQKLATVPYESVTAALGTAPKTTATGGNALFGVKKHWGVAEIYVEQTLNLPVGKYTMIWESFINQSSSTASSMMGYEMDGLGIYDTFPSATGIWKNNTLTFVVTTPKKVKIRMGYKKTTANAGADTSLILFVDNVKLLKAMD